jgi:hypothetical protein
MLIAMSSFPSLGQSSAWSLSTVSNTNKETVGYIYHVYARGIMSRTRQSGYHFAAGLRFVCSTKSKENASPIIAVFWNGPLMVNPMHEINITVDNTAGLNEKWYHEGSLLYSNTVDQPSLIAAMKQGKTIKFSWEGNDFSKYVVVFDLKDFKFAEFNSACKTQL